MFKVLMNSSHTHFTAEDNEAWDGHMIHPWSQHQRQTKNPIFLVPSPVPIVFRNYENEGECGRSDAGCGKNLEANGVSSLAATGGDRLCP